MAPKFGPAGNSEIFYSQGHKSSLEAPEWLHDMGLDAFEYPCSRGVNIKEDKARILGSRAQKFNIALSIHAPYYINLASNDEAKIENSINYILDSAKAASWMGAKRVVLHPGSCSGIDREVALDSAIAALRRALDRMKEMNLSNIILCPETMGKRNQLGTVDEIVKMCSIDESLIPTLDFGHINALGRGCLADKDDFRDVLEKIKNGLGEYRLKNLHSHFSRIEFTDAGEKKHHRLCDTQYGPEFEPLAELLYELKMEPTIICESRGTMAEDALTLKGLYMKAVK